MDPNRKCRLNAFGFVTAMLTAFFAATLLGDGSAQADPASPPSGQPVAEECWADRFPVLGGIPVQCCQDGQRTWHTNDNRVLAFRTYGSPCREADGIGVNCGVGSVPFVPCAYGPCGGRNEWAIVAEEVRIFEPVSKPNKCGWEVRDIVDVIICTDPDGCEWQVKGFRFYPEPYADQPIYGGVTSTCPFRRCLVGGVPTP